MWAIWLFIHQAAFIRLYVSYLGDLSVYVGHEKKEILFLLTSRDAANMGVLAT